MTFDPTSSDLQTAGLGPVSRAKLQTAADRSGLGVVLAAEPASSGNFGQNILLTTSRGDYVFRGNPFVTGQLAREQYFAEVFHQRCPVPAPWPYHYEPSRELFGWPYALMGRIPGVQIADETLWSALSLKDHSNIAAALGRAAVHITAVTYPDAGQWMPDSAAVEPFVPDWATWVQQTIAEQAESAAGLTSQDREWITAVLEHAKPFLEQRFQPVLVHGDFSRHNATGRRTPSGWDIAGVYDLASCHYGHPAEILTRQFADFCDHHRDLAALFVQTALDHSQLLAGHCRDVDGLTALVLLERIGIWEWAKRSGRGWWSADLNFIDWIGNYRRLLADVLNRHT